jgi:hypothetical protein
VIKWVSAERSTFQLPLVDVVGLSAPAAAHVSQTAAAPVYTMTPARITASTAILIALFGAIIGGLALVRSVRRIGNRG